MRKLICSALMAVSLQAFPAHAEWTSITKGKSKEIYVDWDTLVIDGKIANISYLVDFEQAQDSRDGKFHSVGMLTHFDCASAKHFLEISIFFSDKYGNGNVISAFQFVLPSDKSYWEDIATLSITETTWKEVCARVGSLK